jgi:DNA-directed RNA polymerase specialized sigma24 family protein
MPIHLIRFYALGEAKGMEVIMVVDEKRSLEDEITLVFEEQYGKLFGMVYRMMENVQDTEDVLQNVYIKAFQNVNKFRGDSQL